MKKAMVHYHGREKLYSIHEVAKKLDMSLDAVWQQRHNYNYGKQYDVNGTKKILFNQEDIDAIAKRKGQKGNPNWRKDG